MRLRAGLEKRGRTGRSLAARSAYGLVGLVGYILSPASWWNDAVVNIPLALALAKLLNTLTGLGMELGFTLAYWASNILGVILMAAGAGGALGGKMTGRSLALSLAAATAYTLVVVALLQAL